MPLRMSRISRPPLIGRKPVRKPKKKTHNLYFLNVNFSILFLLLWMNICKLVFFFAYFQLKEGPKHIPHYSLLLVEVKALPTS